ncbi:MAG: Peptidase [Candidatus Amesbacteria bacterium GW2011_GWB1_47_26]|uniref:Peptidase n=1 Tax=Candidatus Amesbacteria bacterium GW2011_GWC2_45_19 TaxID=1618366 RepID=A0A0G1M0C3_9BACT|nr:MAG: Peptidase [Candidatus Amesbacteria bacterium GW2011_GWC2_45_19]KKU37119.1 MAG: Peptidase [Candidatus Amesbacteria bacterium GW2011_GWA1_46_35]KKU73084.1 MAG: Peptidase [Candidatus Amesbacteria bacterium GW2011_GWB1_47_26]KKU79106.1 MAG: Peptidase [Candidatus Amesbacteria bacterium GW2011_GWA2_47_70]
MGVWLWSRSVPMITPVIKRRDRPLDKYTIENLGKREYQSQIFIDDEVSPGVFKFHFDSDGKKVTGLAHVPNGCKKCPVIVQFRGYVERDIYQPGMGTKRTAEAFAKNGFISLAPDFLGYGESDNPPDDVFAERFLTYVTGLNLLAGIESWEKAGSIGIWGHSNGGQIALTVLEISQKEYPTVLWAPVSKPFPYSILYYTDEAEDKGKLLRKKLAKFEQDYDVDLYSLTNYLDRITAPLQIHQGTADEAVPQKWSDEFIKGFKIKNFPAKRDPALQEKLKISYYLYPGADHNLVGAWDRVVRRDVEFFRRYFGP